jgi:hypothetical protein
MTRFLNGVTSTIKSKIISVQNVKLNHQKFYLFSALVFFTIINASMKYVMGNISMLVTLFSCSVLLFKSRKDLGHFTLFVFITYAMITISTEYLSSTVTASSLFFYNEFTYNFSISILCFFITFVSIFYNYKRDVTSYSVKCVDNTILYNMLVILSIGIMYFGMNRINTTVYSSKINTLYEYFALTVLFAFKFSGKSIRKKLVLVIIILIYILQDFSYGGRISTLQLGIMIVLVLFSKILSYKHIIIFSIPALLILNVVYIYRNNHSLNNIIPNLISFLINSTKNYEYNTFSDVLYSSSAFIYSKLFIFNWSIPILSFVAFFLNIFLGGRFDYGNVTVLISSKISALGGGGYLPVFFYFWFDWLGVILISIFIVWILNIRLKHSNSEYWTLLTIVFISLVPRWFVYSPLVLFRYVFLNFSLLYYSLIVSHKFLQSTYFNNLKTSILKRFSND